MSKHGKKTIQAARFQQFYSSLQSDGIKGYAYNAGTIHGFHNPHSTIEIMPRFSDTKRRELYTILCRRDGERCFIGTEPGTPENLVIDHWDNDPENNDLGNLHLMCRSANAVKNPRGRDRRHKKHCTSEGVCVCEQIGGIETIRTVSAEFARSNRAMPAFRHWLFHMICRKRRLDLDDVINSGAEIAHCSQETIKRYLGRWTANGHRADGMPAGLFDVHLDPELGKKIIELKSIWDTFSPRLEAERELERQAKNWRRI